MNYSEEKNQSKIYKENYLSGIERIIEQRQKEAEAVRRNYIKDIVKDPEKYRADFKKMLGWPLADYTPEALPPVKSELLSKEKGYELYRMQFEILPGLEMTGLFFKAEGSAPLVIVQHGGLGTPELISGVYGSTENYNDMLMRVKKHRVHVFAPQLLLWSEGYEVPFDRKEIDARLKRVGSSITAIEVFGITRVIDYFEEQPFVKNFGMVGMSYGGFYTLFTAAADTRIKAAISCSFFNKRDIIGWADWVWQNSAERFDDAEVACLVYPRKIWIHMGNKDPLFDSKYTEEAFARVGEVCPGEWTKLKIFEGLHEFYKGDEYIEELINELEMCGE